MFACVLVTFQHLHLVLSYTHIHNPLLILSCDPARSMYISLLLVLLLVPTDTIICIIRYEENVEYSILKKNYSYSYSTWREKRIKLPQLNIYLHLWSSTQLSRENVYSAMRIWGKQDTGHIFCRGTGQKNFTIRRRNLWKNRRERMMRKMLLQTTASTERRTEIKDVRTKTVVPKAELMMHMLVASQKCKVATQKQDLPENLYL